MTPTVQGSDGSVILCQACCFGSTSPSEGSLQVNTKLLWVISFLTSDEMNGLFKDDNTPIHRAREVTEGFDECDRFMWIVPFGFHTRRVQHSWMGYQSQIVDWHLKLPTTLSFMNFGAKYNHYCWSDALYLSTWSQCKKFNISSYDCGTWPQPVGLKIKLMQKHWKL